MSDYHRDLLGQVRENGDYRRVVTTTEHTQLVLMSIPPGAEIGMETHDGIDQILIAVEGDGKSVIGGMERPFAAGDAAVVPQGVQHNFVNTGSEPLRLITVYGPPEHPPGTIHPTKADANRAEAA